MTAKLRQSPRSLMSSRFSPARDISVAAPLLNECRPMFFSSPALTAQRFKALSAYEYVSGVTVPECMYENKGAPGREG